MCKRLGPVRVKRSKYPLLLLLSVPRWSVSPYTFVEKKWKEGGGERSRGWGRGRGGEEGGVGGGGGKKREKRSTHSASLKTWTYSAHMTGLFTVTSRRRRHTYSPLTSFALFRQNDDVVQLRHANTSVGTLCCSLLRFRNHTQRKKEKHVDLYRNRSSYSVSSAMD